jgi:outer membrane lipoprotein carrier protein
MPGALSAAAAEPESESPLALAYTCTAPLKQSELLGIVDKVQDAYRSIKGMQAQFKQESSVVALDQTEGSSGMVSFLKPGNMKWEYTSPEAQVFLLRDSTVWFYQEALKQVVIDDISQVLLSDLPVSFLMGIGELSRDFSLIKGCHAGERILLDLAPRTPKNSRSSKAGSGDSQLGSFRLLVDKTKFLPLGAVVSDLGGNSTAILFSQLRLNPAQLSLDAFKPQFPKGIDVSDRRALLDTRQVTAEGLTEREVLSSASQDMSQPEQQ